MKCQTDQNYAPTPKFLKYQRMCMWHYLGFTSMFWPTSSLLSASNYLTAFCSHTCAVSNSKSYHYGMQNIFLFVSRLLCCSPEHQTYTPELPVYIFLFWQRRGRGRRYFKKVRLLSPTTRRTLWTILGT